MIRFMTFAPIWLQITKAELFSVSVGDTLFVGKIWKCGGKCMLSLHKFPANFLKFKIKNPVAPQAPRWNLKTRAKIYVKSTLVSWDFILAPEFKAVGRTKVN